MIGINWSGQARAKSNRHLSDCQIIDKVDPEVKVTTKTFPSIKSRPRKYRKWALLQVILKLVQEDCIFWGRNQTRWYQEDHEIESNKGRHVQCFEPTNNISSQIEIISYWLEWFLIFWTISLQFLSILSLFYRLVMDSNSAILTIDML